MYSYDFDTIREAVVVPNHHWGGEGLLGCVFGFVFITIHCTATMRLISELPRFGLLHRIPAQPADRQPGSMPPELSEPSDEYEEQELFVPADIDHHEIETPEATRREYFARHFSYERRASSDTETENHIHEREAGVHTPTPHSHDRPSYLGQSPSMLSPTPTRTTNASFMNGDSAPHS